MTPTRRQEIERVYHAALERSPADRAAFLSKVCKNDPELGREVESLLAQESSKTGALDPPSWDGLASSVGTVTLIAPGTQLGPYKIEGPLGKGGMGEVFRGVDTRLGRSVAVKTSHEQFSTRFDREARAISALNHPHICTLYDVGPNYLVMELCEGETLAARLKRGKLSIQETARYGAQIADALSAAHAKGIVHRDLKPGNIMIVKSGVKVLDFGLAKSPQDATLTASRAVMGTPAYMAPEQREGKECDARTDIYALGLLLYEMATGQRARSTQPPHLDALSSGFAHVAERCLAEDPEGRWQTAQDLKLELEWAASADRGGKRPPRTEVGPAKAWWAMTGVLVILLIGAAATAYRATRLAPLRPLLSLNLDLNESTPLARALNGNMLALSPDGARLALTLRSVDDKVRLHTRLLNQNQATLLAGTENARDPFFSPDGAWIGFFADGKLKKISVQGGAAVPLCDAPNPRGASWGDDGNIIAALSNNGVLSRVPPAGGTPEPVTNFTSGERTHRWPQVLPGSQAVLFTAADQTGSFDDAKIDVVWLKTGERKTVHRGGFSPRYLATSNKSGHLIYLHQTTLFAVPFDLRHMTTAGTPAPIIADVSSSSMLEAGGDFAFGQNATFIYLAGNGQQAAGPILWLDSAGNTQPLYAPSSLYYTPRFSPDGKRLAFSMSNGQGADIWVKDLDRETASRLSFIGGDNRWPVWSPDGKNIVFRSTNQATPGLYWSRSDGVGEARRLTDGKLDEVPYSFSPDARWLAFQQNGNAGSRDIFTAPIEGDPGQLRLGKPELFLGTPFVEVYPAFSPDGRWLAYSSNESGTFEIYVRPFPGPGGQRQISIGGGRFPLWSRDGRQLFFQTTDRRVIVVDYSTTSDSFAVGKPRQWAKTLLMDTGAYSNYDLAPDGKRIAATVEKAEISSHKTTQLTVLLNFFDELRRRVPAGK